MTRKLISSGSAFESQIGYSRAVVSGDFVFVSGTTGFDYSTMTISDDVAEQARQALSNIEAALKQAGASFADVVRVNSVVPGPIENTEGMKRLAPTPETEQIVLESVPLGCMGTVDDIANCCLWLASPMARYLIRDEEGLRPLEVAQIVTITGAQDYSEVATLNGRHLVRMTLGDFERLLDRSQFVRVHRSTIISLAHLDVAEAAGGGRMIARMADGQTIQVSRSGAACLRKWAA